MLIFLLFLSLDTRYDPALSRWIVLPLDSKVTVIKVEILTGDERDSLEFVPPFISDRNLVLSTISIYARVAHLVCVSDELLSIFWFDRVEAVEKVNSRW